jgi:hypothetical protein
MRAISQDKTFIDYFQNISSIHRGVMNLFGIRVLEGRCIAVVKTGDGQICTFGDEYPLPVTFQTLPSHLHSMMDDYLWHYPDSELTDVLAGRKSFQEALNWSPEMPGKAFRISGDNFRKMRSGRG